MASWPPADHPVVDVRDRRRGTARGGRPARSPCTVGLLAAMPDVGAVVHTHSRYAAAFAVARLDLPFICNESIATRSRAGAGDRRTPRPGSADLGEQALAHVPRPAGQPRRAAGQPRRRRHRPDAGRRLRRGPVRRVDGRDLPPRPHAARRRRRRARPRPGACRTPSPATTASTIAEPARNLMDADRGRRPLRARAAAGRGRLLPPALAVAAGRRRSPTARRSSPCSPTPPTASPSSTASTIDELWHFYLGDAVELVLLEAGGTSRHVRLGHDLAAGEESSPSSRPGRGWRPAPPAAGACSAHDGARLHRRLLRGCAVPRTLLAGWPGRGSRHRGPDPARCGPRMPAL